MANRFVLNETSYHGAGAIANIAVEAKNRGFKKAFVCSDPDLIKFGVTKKVLDVLDADGLTYEVYDNIKPNPTIENVQTGVEAFKKSGADYLIAIGGGSSMDTAKAIENASTQLTFIGFNASIEAKRAGAAGAGFNVIAQEVRTLADKNTKQANEVENTLNEIKKAIVGINAQLKTCNAEIQKNVEVIEKLKTLVDEANAQIQELK